MDCGRLRLGPAGHRYARRGHPRGTASTDRPFALPVCSFCFLCSVVHFSNEKASRGFWVPGPNWVK